MPRLDPHIHLVGISRAEAALIRMSLEEYAHMDEETAAMVTRLDSRLAVLATHEPPMVVMDRPEPILAAFGVVEVHRDECHDDTCQGGCIHV